MADLKTTYKDDLLDTSVNEKRKYNMIQNADGTVSFEDVTTYSQIGDSFGAADINSTNEKVNEVNSNLSTNDGTRDQTFKFAYDSESESFGYITKDSEGADTFRPFKSDATAELLWTNNAFTTAFASQTISLDLSKYDCICIESFYATHNQSLSRTYINKNDSACMCSLIEGYKIEAASQYAGIRYVSVKEDGIYFSYGVFNQGANNTMAIPYKIYGVNAKLPL